MTIGLIFKLGSCSNFLIQRRFFSKNFFVGDVCADNNKGVAGSWVKKQEKSSKLSPTEIGTQIKNSNGRSVLLSLSS